MKKRYYEVFNTIDGFIIGRFSSRSAAVRMVRKLNEQRKSYYIRLVEVA